MVHKALTRAEAGCLVFEVTQNPDNPLRFDVYEEFIDAA
ncbi:putative quinol monooxygenase, partial [Vibrio tritonius]